MSLLRLWSASISIHKHPSIIFSTTSLNPSPLYISRNSFRKNLCCCLKPNHDQNGSHSLSSGMEDAFMGYLLGKKKATDVAHTVWRHVVQKGDIVVDATCGNGYDTLQMLKLVADDSHKGFVYALDIQKDALVMTSSLLDDSLNPTEKQNIKLFNICHSKMEEVIPREASVRLIAFNLGYLPGGDKEIITRSETTLLALEAAKRVIMPGGLVSLVVYVGHPGGREELETIEAFAARLPPEKWICCKLQMLNRPSAPIPIFLFKR